MNNLIWKKHSVHIGFIYSLKQHGIVETTKGVLSYLWRQVLYASYPIYRKVILDNKRQFVFQQERYNYCLEKYNLSWRNERTIEIPIIQKVIKDHIKLNILEIGCVLKHYDSSPKINWTIVDKYEKFTGVINKDITEYYPKTKFDLIVSISTIEHIGMEDGAITPNKAKYVINQVRKNLLNINGKFIFTIPIGYNKSLDKQIFSNKITFSEKHYVTRISNNEWLETTQDKVLNSKYNKPYICANALFIGVIKN